MRPDDANVAGNVHGGTILKMIEEAGAIISTRHCNSQNRVGVWGRSPAWERPPAGGPAVRRAAPLLGQGGVWEEEPSPPRSSALGTSGSSTPPALVGTPGSGDWFSAQLGRVGTKLVACQQLPLNTFLPVWKRLGF